MCASFVNFDFFFFFSEFILVHVGGTASVLPVTQPSLSCLPACDGNWNSVATIFLCRPQSLFLSFVLLFFFFLWSVKVFSFRHPPASTFWCRCCDSRHVRPDKFRFDPFYLFFVPLVASLIFAVSFTDGPSFTHRTLYTTPRKRRKQIYMALEV